jgi:hypothetical protein
LVALCPVGLAANSGHPKNVLVLYSFSKRDNFDSLQPLEATLRSLVPTPVNFYVEYLESLYQRPVFRPFPRGSQLWPKPMVCGQSGFILLYLESMLTPAPASRGSSAALLMSSTTAAPATLDLLLQQPEAPLHPIDADGQAALGEKFIECFPKTGVYKPGTMFPNWTAGAR